MTGAALPHDASRKARTTRADSHYPVAILSNSAADVAIAALTFALPALDDSDLVEIQLTPAGAFRPRDGRDMTVDAWHIDADSAALVIARFDRLTTPPVLDYEHQTLLAEQNGQPAPAAGFFKQLRWREGEGLFGVVELTPRAREYIERKEYRFFSPVIRFNPATGVVTDFVMGALTNNPAIDGMKAIALRALLTYAPENPMTTKTNRLLVAVLTALALPQETTEDAAIAALSALQNKPDPLVSIRTALGAPTDASAETIATACATLKAKANTTAANSVPLETFEQVKQELAALSARVRDNDVDALVKTGLDDGRLLPAQETWARDLGKTNFAALKSYLDTTQPIAALVSQQTRGNPPVNGGDAHGLNADELAVCSATGIAPADFAKTKAAQR